MSHLHLDTIKVSLDVIFKNSELIIFTKLKSKKKTINVYRQLQN